MLEIKAVEQKLARSLVEQFHYSKNLPTNVSLNFGIFIDGIIGGVACYGPCVSRKAPTDWLELRRLVRVPGAEFVLSSFLAKTIKLLKQQKVPALLSWADPQESHHGGIYQATNWIYTEQKGGGNHTFIDDKGTHIHPRTVYARFGTQSVPRVLALNPTWTSFLPPTKHRYLMPLNISKEQCLERLNTKQLPYPKPDRQPGSMISLQPTSAPVLATEKEPVIMAAPRGRGRPPKINAQAEQLSLALAFVSVAAIRDDSLECAPYVTLGGNMAVVFSRQLCAGHPIAEDLTLSPHLDKLKAALARCGKTLTLAQTPSGGLSVSGDKLRAVVPCWADAIPMLEPDPPVAQVDDRLRAAFKACNHFSSEAGESVVEASLLLEANTCTSTNRYVILQFWHGIDLPPHMVLPKLFTAAVCKVEKPITGFGFTWDYNLQKPGSVTIWFEGGAWLRCQCYSDRWPDISPIVDAENFPVETPAGFFEAVEAVEQFSDDRTPSVYFADGKLMSHNTVNAGGQYEVAGIQAGKRFSAEFLRKVAPFVTHLDLTTHPDKLYFTGGDEKGPMRGAVMGMTGGVAAQPQALANDLAPPAEHTEAEPEAEDGNVGWGDGFNA